MYLKKDAYYTTNFNIIIQKFGYETTRSLAWRLNIRDENNTFLIMYAYKAFCPKILKGYAVLFWSFVYSWTLCLQILYHFLLQSVYFAVN